MITWVFTLQHHIFVLVFSTLPKRGSRSKTKQPKIFVVKRESWGWQIFSNRHSTEIAPAAVGKSGEKSNQPVFRQEYLYQIESRSRRAALKNKVNPYWTYLNEAMIYLACQTIFNRKCSLNSVLSSTSTTSERNNKLLKLKNSNTVHPYGRKHKLSN